MKFVVKPIDPQKKGPPYHTLCVLCSEDPRWCGVPI
jgi:hypothetical protein